MLSQNDIIYFSNDWNADNKTSSHHIAMQLAKNNRVLYIESGGLRTPKSSIYDFTRIVKKLSNYIRGLRLEQNNLRTFSPILIPFHKIRGLKLLNKITPFSSECQIVVAFDMLR